MKIAMVKIIFLYALIAPAAAEQPPEDALKGVIASAKIAGGCALLIQMLKFQDETKMAGGDEFLNRFYNMEIARLGLTPEQHTKMCADAGRVVQFYSEGLSGDGR